MSRENGQLDGLNMVVVMGQLSSDPIDRRLPQRWWWSVA